MKPWFRFENATNDPTTVDIHIIDFIGGWVDDMINRFWNEEIGVTARAFVEKLAALPDTVQALNIHINSPGGDVQGGINIANALRAETAKGRTVTTYVDGLAASIASVIAMAGQKVFIADNALMMIHDPWGGWIGNARELRKTADVLDTMGDQIVATYKWHVTDLSDADIKALMAEETWMTADEAIAYGFATDKVEGLKAAAAISRASLKALKVPEQHRARVEACFQPAAPQPAPAAAAEVTRLCAEAGASSAFVAALVAANLPLDQAKARIDADKAARDAADAQARQAREAAEARATAIRGACDVAKLPVLAEAFITGGMSLEAVKAQVTTIRALLDGKADVDGTLQPDNTAATAEAGWKRAFGRSEKRNG